MATLQVDLVAPDRVVWTGEARMVIARTADGDIGVLPGHAPVLGVIRPGVVQIHQEGGERLVAAVLGGFLSVADNVVAVLAEQVELPSEIDVSQAEADLREARGRSAGDAETQAAVEEAEARMRAHSMAF